MRGGVGADVHLGRGGAREMGSGSVGHPLIPSSPGYKPCTVTGLGCKALLPVRTLVPSVQGPTKDSGQRRQSPLAVPQPPGEQQVLRASWNAVNWVHWKRPAMAPFLSRSLEPEFQQRMLNKNQAIKMYSCLGPPLPSLGEGKNCSVSRIKHTHLA